MIVGTAPHHFRFRKKGKTMKKTLSVLLILVLVISLFTGCSMKRTVTEDKILDFLSAVSEDDEAAAKALMHRQADALTDGTFSGGFDLIVKMIDGRKAVSAKQTSYNVSTQIGTSSGRTESGTFSVTLDDGSVVDVDFTYLKDITGEGFIGFHITLGAGSAL